MTGATAIRAAIATSVLVVALSGCASTETAPQQGAAKIFSVGDCVAIPSTAPDTLRAGKVSCTADPSYTVGAITNASGTCPSTEYQHLPTQFADSSTSRLCLVPNLMANHCYVLDMPVGVVQLADCADRGGQGLLVQVKQRLDVRDQRACPSEGGQYAWPYPSPPRTYCTQTIF